MSKPKRASAKDGIHGGHLRPAERLQKEMYGDLHMGEGIASSAQQQERKITPVMTGSGPTPVKTKGGKPLQVQVGYKVNSLGEVDSLTAAFEVDFKLFVHWEDPAFVGKEKGVLGKDSGSKLDPKLEFMNSRKLITYYQEATLKDPKKGSIKVSMYCRGWMMMLTMDLYMFPFDCQNLQIGIKPKKRELSEVVLVPGERGMNTMPRHEWNFVGHLCKSYHTDPATSSTKKIYSSLHIIMLVERESGWYVKNIILPSVGMVVLNCTVYAFPLSDIGSRMEIAVGLVLATAVNKLVASDKLAKVPYQTFIDRFQSVCFYYQLWIGIQMPFIFLMTVGIDPTAGWWLNIILFVSSTLCFILLCYFFTQSLTRHLEDVDGWKSLADSDDSPTHRAQNKQRGSRHVSDTIGLVLNSPTEQHKRQTHQHSSHSFDFGSQGDLGSLAESEETFVEELEHMNAADAADRQEYQLQTGGRQQQRSSSLQQQQQQQQQQDNEEREIRTSAMGGVLFSIKRWGKRATDKSSKKHRLKEQFEIDGLAESRPGLLSPHNRESQFHGHDQQPRTDGEIDAKVPEASDTRASTPPPAVAITGPASYRTPPATLLLHTWATVQQPQDGAAEELEAPEVKVTIVVYGCEVEEAHAVLGWSEHNGKIGLAEHVVKIPESVVGAEIHGEAKFTSNQTTEIVPFVLRQTDEDSENEGDEEDGRLVMPKCGILAEAHHFSGLLTSEMRDFVDLIASGKKAPSAVP